jgi:hypothetical protein
MSNFTKRLCNVERDRVTAAEICIDELITIMDRHGVVDQMRIDLGNLSRSLHALLTEADGVANRRSRLIRIRGVLTDAMPMTDEDLEASHDRC